MWKAASETCLAKRVDRMRQRDPLKLATQIYDDVLASAGLKRGDVAYCATTGEGEALRFPHRPFLFDDDACPRRHLPAPGLPRRARHRRAARPRHPHRRTRQGAQLQDDEPMRVGLRPVPGEHRALSRHRPGRDRHAVEAGATIPEKVSGICAVLAETDVINMVSRGITAPNILKGIHESMADRLAKLLKTIGGLDGTIQMTGGLALDAGLVEAMKEAMVARKSPCRSKAIRTRSSPAPSARRSGARSGTKSCRASARAAES